MSPTCRPGITSTVLLNPTLARIRIDWMHQSFYFINIRGQAIHHLLEDRLAQHVVNIESESQRQVLQEGLVPFVSISMQ